MKKSLILAALLAAIVLWGGVLAGCSDDSSSGSSSSGSKIAADSLPAPVGTNPFKKGFYESVTTPKNDDEEPYTEYYYVDTDSRTMTLYYDENKEIVDVMIKYTYNEGNHTLTMAVYKIAIETDNGWNLFGKKEFDNYMDDLLKEINAVLKNTTDRELLEEIEEFRDDIIEAKAEAAEEFAKTHIFSYTVSADGNTVTFEDDEEKSVDTFLHE